MNPVHFDLNGNNSVTPLQVKDENSLQTIGVKFYGIDYKMIDSNLRKSPNIKMFVRNTIDNPFEDSILGLQGYNYNFQQSMNNASFSPFLLKKDNNHLVNDFAESLNSGECEEINNKDQHSQASFSLNIPQIISYKSSLNKNLIKENTSNYLKIIEINPKTLFILNTVNLPFVVIESMNDDKSRLINENLNRVENKQCFKDLTTTVKNPLVENSDKLNKQNEFKEKIFENNSEIPKSYSLFSKKYGLNDCDNANFLPEVGFPCKMCSERFLNGQALGGHMSRKHTGSSIDYEKKKDVRSKRLYERVVLYIAKTDFYGKKNLNYEELRQSKEGKNILKQMMCRASIKKIKEEITESQVRFFLEQHPFFDKFRLSKKDLNKKEIIEQAYFN